MMMFHVSGKDGTTLYSGHGCPPFGMMPPNLRSFKATPHGREVHTSWTLPEKEEAGDEGAKEESGMLGRMFGGKKRGKKERTCAPLAEVRLSLYVQHTAYYDDRTASFSSYPDTPGPRVVTFVDVSANDCSHVLELPPDEQLLVAAGELKAPVARHGQAPAAAPPATTLTLHIQTETISDKGAIGWGGGARRYGQSRRGVSHHSLREN